MLRPSAATTRSPRCLPLAASAAAWIESTPTTPERAYEIIGVVKDAKYHTIGEQPRSVAFLARDQHPSANAGGQFIVRTSSSPDTVAPLIGPALLEVNPNMPSTKNNIDEINRYLQTRTI